MTSEEIINTGKEILANIGVVESEINHEGKLIVPSVPGLGAVGGKITFGRNREALKKYAIKTRLLGKTFIPDTSVKLFGMDLAFPIIAAPMSGIKTSLRGIIEERVFLTSILEGCKDVGTIGMCGDSYDITSDYIVPGLIKQFGGIGVCKPRSYEKLKERIDLLKETEPIAIGIDLDGVAGMLLDTGQVTRKDVNELEKIRSLFNGPMFLKGILSLEDAELAYKTGFDAIVISNHGGRSIDYVRGTADVLPEIADKFKGKMKILVDGGIRNGYDVYVYLALGADVVLTGRTILYSVIGGKTDGVKTTLLKLASDLRRTMIFTGAQDIEAINSATIELYE